MRSTLRLLLIALALLLPALSLVGCMGGGMSATLRPPTQSEIETLRTTLEELDALPDPEAEAKRLHEVIDQQQSELAAADRSNRNQLTAALSEPEFRIAYCYERVKNYPRAVEMYAAATKHGAQTEWAMLAGYRAGIVADLGLHNAKDAGNYYWTVGQFHAAQVWEREPLLASEGQGTFALRNAQEATLSRFDRLNRRHAMYRMMDILTTVCGGRNRPFAGGLALILLALVVKVITTPFTAAQFRSMKAMQKVQPYLKELQEKHKGDRELLGREQMRLFKEHKVNPLGGCLPMLIQMPVLIMVYQGIRMYIYWYSKSTFLWITPSFPFPQFHGANLAQADMPLVLLYTVAMYLSQKLTTMPTADPQQQQTQKMMTIMMPLMFAIFFKGFPAAFLLYWLMLTIFSSAHQYYVLKQPDAVPAAGLALPAASAVPEVGKRPPGVRPKQLPSKKKRR